MWVGTSGKGKLSSNRDEARRNMPTLNQIPRALFTEHNKATVYDKLKANEGKKRREAWAESSDEEYNSDSQRHGRHELMMSENKESLADGDVKESPAAIRSKKGGQLKPLNSPSKSLSPDQIRRAGKKRTLSTPLSPMSTDSLHSFSSPSTASLLTASVSSTSSLLSGASPSPDRGLLHSRSSRGSPSTPLRKSKGPLLSGLVLPGNMESSCSPTLRGIPVGGSAELSLLLSDEDDNMSYTSETGETEEQKSYGYSYMENSERSGRQTRKAVIVRKRDKSPQGLMKRRLRVLHDSLESVTEEQKELKSMLLSEADKMVSQLPLSYLASKPELRHYAMERAGRPVIQHMLNVVHGKMKWALDRWRTNFPPNAALDERQVAFLCIADRLSRMIKPVYRGAFEQWARLYSSRYQLELGARREAAAREIQSWYRHVRITKRKLFKFFTDAVKVCLDRRKGIKHMILYESKRRSALLKFQRAIAGRRRKWFAARNLMRPYQWFKLYRKVQVRLTRRINVRLVQRWFRMTRCRSAKELYLIRNILRYGGYTRVMSKIPEDLLRRNGLLLGFEQCASRIQRAWFVSKGNFAAFMIAAARRAKEEYQQMLNDNATIIQQNFRGHLWNLLNLAAIQHNRARRISFAFRHYQWRVWVARRVARRVHRPATRIQRFCKMQMWKALLSDRFKLRKVTKIWFNIKRQLAAASIQREYRAHLERLRIAHEEFLAWVKQQRENAEKTALSIRFIQMAWRKKLRVNRFPRHVYLACWRTVREHRSYLNRMAGIIQRRTRKYLVVMRAIWKAELIRCANVIWYIAKSYLLKLAVFDRVEATMRTQRRASNVIKRNLRTFLFIGKIDLRCKIRRAQRLYKKFMNDAATYIQRWIMRKFVEYYLPVRTSARASLKKRRMDEEARRVLNIQNKSASFISRFFRLFPLWNKQMALIARERHRILRIHKARCIQKLARRIIAWQRFAMVVAYKKRQKLAAMQMEQMRNAVNIIGYYYKRKLEKFELYARFKNRRWMIDEFNRLDAERVEAERVRDIAVEDKRRTDENMRATINASWKQGSDVNGKNYYYNYVTGESSWDVPEGFKVPVAINKWLKQLDDRQNVYYYNMETQESSWLPPCTLCGDASEKWCQECSCAYCDRCFDEYHELDEPDTEDNGELKAHKWSLVQYEKDVLKPGEIYCLECQRRTAVRMCLECWDAYCDECFRYTHHTGSLKYHKTMAYKKVKLGWMTIKSKDPSDPDYYVNGATGITQYEKPFELMTESEKKLYGDFLSHQKAANEYVKKIDQLQHELEEASFERDSIMQDAMKAGFMGPSVTSALDKKKRRKKKMDDVEASSTDVVGDAIKNNKPGPFDWLTGSMTEYRDKLLKPQERERGAAKSDYIGALLEDISKERAKKKELAKKDAGY